MLRFCASLQSIATLMLLQVIFATNVFAAPLKPTQGEYDVLRNGSLLGVGHIRLEQRDQDNWVFSNHSIADKGFAKLIGVEISETSQFLWRDDQPRMVAYQFQQDTAWKQKKRSVVRVENSDEINSKFDARDIKLGPHPNAVDRNLASVVLMTQLASDSKAKSIEVHVIDKDKIDTHIYQIGKLENIKTEIGSYDAIRIDRVRQIPGRTTVSWFAPSLGYLPIKIVQTEPDGEIIELLLRKLPNATQ